MSRHYHKVCQKQYKSLFYLKNYYWVTIYINFIDKALCYRKKSVHGKAIPIGTVKKQQFAFTEPFDRSKCFYYRI